MELGRDELVLVEVVGGRTRTVNRERPPLILNVAEVFEEVTGTTGAGSVSKMVLGSLGAFDRSMTSSCSSTGT